MAHPKTTGRKAASNAGQLLVALFPNATAQSPRISFLAEMPTSRQAD